MAKIFDDITPVKGHVLVINMEKGERVSRGGIIITDDNGKDRGIRPRWAQIYKVGKDVTDMSPGEWILIEHGRWTHGVDMADPNNSENTLYVQRADTSAILLISDEQPVL